MDIHGPLSQARKWFPFFAVCVIGFGLTMPTALCGYHKGDTIHLVWAKHFSEQFWAGELYPRWLFRMNSGLGSLQPLTVAGVLVGVLRMQASERREWSQERRTLIDRAIAQHTGEVIALDRSSAPPRAPRPETVRPIAEGL